MKRLFLDLETTGFSPKYASILEIAAIVVDFENGEPQLLDSFHEYIRPYRPIPSDITELTGISDKMVANCKSEIAVLNNFATWIIGNEWDSLTPVAHNGAFDFRFLTGRAGLYKNCLGASLFSEMKDRLIDTLPLARQLIKSGQLVTEESKATLGNLADAFDIKFNAHSALEDTKALVLVYQGIQKITGGEV